MKTVIEELKQRVVSTAAKVKRYSESGTVQGERSKKVL